MNSLRTERLKWFGKLRVTLSLMKDSMTACESGSETKSQVLHRETSFDIRAASALTWWLCALIRLLI